MVRHQVASFVAHRWVRVPVVLASLLATIGFAPGMLAGAATEDILAAPQQPDFDTTPLWRSSHTDPTRGVAWGDMDRDGDLDLVCVNLGQPATVYLNLGTTLSTSPSWSAAGADTATSVALGDVDSDGDLDLVCGTMGWSAVLYRNTGSGFEATRSWLTAVRAPTWCVALGDVDGDQDIDLLCATDGGGLALFRNQGTVFETSPSWISEERDALRGVVLGDIDNDGDPDLVCGSEGQGARFYRNLGNGFAPRATWSSGRQDYTWSVALGDVDGDGDLDLVCGNSAQSTILHLNTGTTFDRLPAWQSGPAELVRSVALGDVDGDGNLDLLCGVYGAGARIYRNLGTGFEPQPSWSSPEPEATWSIAPADVDSDGDLDLVCGNYSAPSVLYCNLAPRLAATPTWTASQPDYTRCITLGDVDGDSDLDLVCGNEGTSTTLYRYAGGGFEASPSWSSSRQDATRSVALGDVDNDGDLDLVCGNYLGSMAVYRNTGAGLETSPSWLSPSTLHTLATALGDIDRDGDLDLVCAAYFDGVAMYRNAGGSFGSQPAWQTSLLGYAWNVALGDVDGDGNLDLVVGYHEGKTALYLNRGTTFARAPAWQSSREARTMAVALGDVDGDGRPDLVCGNYLERTVCYRNSGNGFEATPFWSAAGAAPTLSVALGDLDADGRPDLVCGNSGGSVQIFRNLGTGFDTTPSWSSQESYDTWQVALGDVNDDGDLDLVAGNHAQPSVLFESRRSLASFADPLRPTRQLPNSDAGLRSVRGAQGDGNTVRVEFRTIDADSDPVWIVADYPHAGSWVPVQLRGGTPPLGPLAASPSGVVHAFEWDVTGLALGAHSIALRLRALSMPRRSTLVQSLPVYVTEVGPVDVRRPVISVDTNAVSFPWVTVGDTVTVDFTISNPGNSTLHVTSFTLPSVALSANPMPPFDIAPHASKRCLLAHHPVDTHTPSDSLWVGSDDPLTPVTGLWVTTDAHALDVQTEALVRPPVPLGQAVTVQVVPADERLHIERAQVCFRPRGAAEFGNADMVPFGSTWAGTIPGEAVREEGLEYFVRLENSPVVATSPAGGAASPLALQVQAPTSMEVRAARTSRMGFTEGREVRIEVALPQGASFAAGSLHCRPGGERRPDSWQVVPLATGALRLPEAIIPAALVGPRGVEYWVEVQTLTVILTEPPVQPAAIPDTLRVSVVRLEEDAEHPAGRYRMLSVPLDLGGGASATLQNLLIDEAEFGPYDPQRWRAFHFVPGEGNVELAAGDPRFRPLPGQAYWVITRAPHRVDTAPLEGLSTPTLYPHPVVLAPGWNQVGSPFAFPVRWSDVVKPALVGDPVAFDPRLGTVGDYADSTPTALVPFEGYFVHNAAAGPETLLVPPVAAVPEPDSAAAHRSRQGWPAAAADAWRLRLLASTDVARDGSNVVGVDDRARDDVDELDRLEPPCSPGDWVRLACVDSLWEHGPGFYRHDIRAPHGEGHAWDIEVRTLHSGEPVTLAIQTATTLPADLVLRLVDVEMAVSIDAGAQGPAASGADGSGSELRVAGATREVPDMTYRLLSHGSARPYRLKLLAGTAAFVARETEVLGKIPERLVLDPNAPNPFNATTRFRFGLPQAGLVSLEIYSARGERLATVLRNMSLPAGYHTVLWSGEDDAGRAAASGVYFFRLRAGGEALTRRMVLIK